SRAIVRLLPVKRREGQDLLSSFSATRSRADRERGFAASSATSGRIALRLRRKRAARGGQVRWGCWGGNPQFFAETWSVVLTRVSSREWKEMTPRRPPGRRVRIDACSP